MNATRISVLALVLLLAAGAAEASGRHLQQVSLPPLPSIPSGCRITSANVTKALPTCKFTDIIRNINSITTIQQLLSYCTLPTPEAIQTAIAGCDVAALTKAITEYIRALLQVLLSLVPSGTAANTAVPRLANAPNVQAALKALLQVLPPQVQALLPADLQGLTLIQVIEQIQAALAAAGINIPTRGL